MIKGWIADVITGDTGFLVMEEYEYLVFSKKNERDIAIAEFVIRALANPECEGSENVLKSIVEQRKCKK